MVDRAMTLNTPTMLQQRRLSNACASTSYHVLRHAVSTPATCRRHWRAISQKRRRPPRVCATTNDQHPTTEPDAQPMVRHLPSSYEDALRESRQFVEAGGMDPVAPPLPGGHVRNDQPVKDDKGMLFDDDEYEHDEEYEGDEEYEQGNVVTAAVESTISRQELADLQASLRAQILTHLTDALYSTPGTLVNNASNPVLDTGERNAKEDSSVMPPTADEAAARTAPVIDDAWARGQQPVWVVATEDASQLCQLLVPQGNDLRPAWIAFQDEETALRAQQRVPSSPLAKGTPMVVLPSSLVAAAAGANIAIAYIAHIAEAPPIHGLATLDEYVDILRATSVLPASRAAMLAEDLVELTIDGTPLLVDQTGEELQVEEWQEETTGDRRNNGASAHVWDGKALLATLAKQGATQSRSWSMLDFAANDDERIIDEFVLQMIGGDFMPNPVDEVVPMESLTEHSSNANQQDVLRAAAATTITVDMGDGLQAVLPRDHPDAELFMKEGSTIPAPVLTEDPGVLEPEYDLVEELDWWKTTHVLYVPAYVYEDGMYACISVNLDMRPDINQRMFVLACQDGRDAARLVHSRAVREMMEEGGARQLQEPYIMDMEPYEAQDIAGDADAAGMPVSCTPLLRRYTYNMRCISYTGVWVLRSGQLPDECDAGWQDFSRAVYKLAVEEQLRA